MSNIILTRHFLKQAIEILPDFEVSLKIEGAYAYLDHLRISNWHIWPIKEGYQAAQLMERVDSKGDYSNYYTNHHHSPGSGEVLKNLIQAQEWVLDQMKLRRD